MADHCSGHALSDSNDSELRSLGSHTHSLKCSQCERLRDVLYCMERYLVESNAKFAPEELEDLSHTLSKAVEAI